MTYFQIGCLLLVYSGILSPHSTAEEVLAHALMYSMYACGGIFVSLMFDFMRERGRKS